MSTKYDTQNTHTMTLPVRIRAAVKSDEPIIYDTFLRSYATTFIRHNGGVEVVPVGAYMAGFRGVMKRFLETRRVLVACPVDSPEVVCAWCSGDSLGDIIVVDYFYTKKDFRGMGLATMLYEALGGSTRARVLFTLWSPKARDLLAKRSSGYAYAPFFVTESWNTNEGDI